MRLRALFPQVSQDVLNGVVVRDSQKTEIKKPSLQPYATEP